MSRELLSDSSTPTCMTFDIHGNHWCLVLKSKCQQLLGTPVSGAN